MSDACEPLRFSDDVMLGFFNMALAEVFVVRPDLSFTIATVQLAANSVVQTIPADGFEFVALHSAGGGAVIEVDKETIDRDRPTWPSDTATAPKQFMRNVKNPRSYFIHPQVSAPVSATLEYAKAPSVYTSISTSISELSSVFLPVLVFGTVYFSDVVDDEHASSGRAEQMHSKFLQALTGNQLQRKVSSQDDAGLQPGSVI